MPYLPVDGARLYYAETGSPKGRPLLLLHAALQTAESMAPLVQLLAPLGFRIVTPDLRGHGRSSHLGQTMTVKGLADDLSVLGERLGIVAPVVVGYSLGGMVGLVMARRGQTEALVVLASRIRPAAKGRETFDPDSIRERSPVWATQLEAKHQELHWAELARQLGEMISTWSGLSPADLAAIVCPLLVVQGDRDELVPLSQAQELASQVSGAELVVVPRAGHPELLYRKDALQNVHDFIFSLRQ